MNSGGDAKFNKAKIIHL